jgi:endonuclease YncB( thermonuclease family)
MKSMRSAERSIRRSVLASKALCLALLFISGQVHAGDFRGRVVGITDGDTISVLHDGKAEKIRLYGIDCRNLSQTSPLGKMPRSK